jgi:hypothetical protein
VFLLFFAFSCSGSKTKNPENEAFSGFCVQIHHNSAEKERAEREKIARWAILAKEPGCRGV